MPYRLRLAFGLITCLLPMVGIAQVPVQTETVSIQPIIKQVSVSGTVTSPRTAVLSTAVAGLVSELNLDEGQRVTIGDTLLQLDAELAQVALERTLAQVRQNEATLEDARRRFAEADQLRSQRGIAATQVESLRAEVASNEAALAAAEAAAREQSAIVSRHTLRAPFSGVISSRLTELGEWVTPGNGVMELVATDNLRFDFQVGQENYAALSSETPVEVALDALPDRYMAGRIRSIVPVKDPSARTFLVRVLACDTDAGRSCDELKITPGMSARAHFDINLGRLGLTVPRDAVLRFSDGRATVWVLEYADGVSVVRERVVQLGTAFDDSLEITRGLSDGDIVVVRGNETLQEGQAVSVVESALP